MNTECVWSPEFDRLWPVSEHKLLIRAALLADESASEAFCEWRCVTGFARYEQIDFESSRILPLVYRNLVAVGAENPWRRELHALHRYHWLRNVNRQRDLFNIVGELNKQDITPILLKGQALLAGGYFEDLGQRTMIDSDLMVCPHQASSVEQLLAGRGWRPVRDGMQPFPFAHAVAWRRREGDEIDLHRKMLHAPFGAVRADHLSQHAETIVRDGVVFQIPSPTDMLLHLCTHARVSWGRNPRPPYLWVADVHRVLEQRQDQIDWDRLFDDSRRLFVLFPVREALGYARAHYQARVPAEWLERARACQLTRQEMRPFFRWMGPPNRYPSAMEMLEHVWDDYACIQRSRDNGVTASSFLGYSAKRLLQCVASGRILKRTIRLLGKTARSGVAGIARPNLFHDAYARLQY